MDMQISSNSNITLEVDFTTNTNTNSGSAKSTNFSGDGFEGVAGLENQFDLQVILANQGKMLAVSTQLRLSGVPLSEITPGLAKGIVVSAQFVSEVPPMSNKLGTSATSKSSNTKALTGTTATASTAETTPTSAAKQSSATAAANNTQAPAKMSLGDAIKTALVQLLQVFTKKLTELNTNQAAKPATTTAAKSSEASKDSTKTEGKEKDKSTDELQAQIKQLKKLVKVLGPFVEALSKLDGANKIDLTIKMNARLAA